MSLRYTPAESSPLADERKRVILANEDEPRTGDYAYGFYDKTHPLYGNKGEINRARRALRGLAGHDVKLVVKGVQIDPDGNEHRFRVQRSGTLNTYRDAFGPGSLYASAVRAIRDKNTDWGIVTFTVEIEDADGEEDSE